MDKRVEEFRRIVNEMADLYEKKNSNYGNSFGKLYEDLGPISGLVPLHNKLDRATNLIKGGKNDFESIEDTFKDLACYAIMNLIEMKIQEESVSCMSTWGVSEINDSKVVTVNTFTKDIDGFSEVAFSKTQGRKLNNLGGKRHEND